MRIAALAIVCGMSVGSLSVGCQESGEIESQTASATPPASSTLLTTSASTAEAGDAVGEGEAGDSAVGRVELKLADLDQLQETIEGQTGKIVVVDVWSTSCAPCMREFPHLVELSQRYPDQVACISFNVDYIGLKSKPPENYRPPVEEFLTKQRALLTNLLSTATDETVLTKFKLPAIPAILIYDANGELLHTLTDVNTGEDGLTYAGDVIPKVEELLAARK